MNDAQRSFPDRMVVDEHSEEANRQKKDFSSPLVSLTEYLNLSPNILRSSFISKSLSMLTCSSPKPWKNMFHEKRALTTRSFPRNEVSLHAIAAAAMLKRRRGTLGKKACKIL